ncbi:MAG: hypothetical protein JW700_02450 [Candidatus Aenigmarchaeota archaeon]|nr:hypothetical protein [Candidatus Aenigmarchaeota archaeon]
MVLFRAYDIRGIYKQDIDEKIMLKMGKALGTMLKGNKNIAVGYDTRLSSKRLFDQFTKGITSTGCNVVNIGMVTTPMLYFYAWKKKTFGAMITASHNPKEWNGLKLVRPSGISFINELDDLKKTYSFGKFIEGNGKMTKSKISDDYLTYIKRKIGRIDSKIVAEFFGGSAVTTIPLLKRLGLEVTALHDIQDVNFFGFDSPDPLNPSNLKTLKDKVKAKKADFGVAFDGDGDRAVFIDEKGNEVDISKVMAIFIDYVLDKKSRGKIIVTRDASSGLKELTENCDGKLIWSKIGHGYIERRIAFEKALFGGEQSAHFSFNDYYPFSDGFLATAVMAKILRENKKSLSEIAKDKKFSMINPIGKFYMNVGSDDNKKKVMKRLKKKYHDEKHVMGGVRMKLSKNEWVLFRPSMNTHEINLCIEAKTKTKLNDLYKKYSSVVKKLV